MTEELTPKDNNYIQKSKYNFWLCNCGSYHIGYPYKCPLKEQAKQQAQEVLNIINSPCESKHDMCIRLNNRIRKWVKK